MGKTTQKYIGEMLDARSRALRFGFRVPDIGGEPRPPVLGGGNNAKSRGICDLLKRSYADPRLLNGACLQVAFDLQPAIERITGESAYLTIGAINILGSEVYNLYGESDIEKWVSSGLANGAEVHAWLTLATMEIVDLTILYTLAYTCPNLGLSPHPLLGRSEVTRVLGVLPKYECVDHRPILVANDFIMRTKAIRGITLS